MLSEIPKKEEVQNNTPPVIPPKHEVPKPMSDNGVIPNSNISPAATPAFVPTNKAAPKTISMDGTITDPNPSPIAADRKSVV